MIMSYGDLMSDPERAQLLMEQFEFHSIENFRFIASPVLTQPSLRESIAFAESSVLRASEIPSRMLMISTSSGRDSVVDRIMHRSISRIYGEDLLQAAISVDPAQK